MGDSVFFMVVSCNFDGGGYGKMRNPETGESFEVPFTIDSKKFIFPYFPEKKETRWFGISIYNNTDENGIATLTLFENDGDIFRLIKTIQGKRMVTTTNDEFYRWQLLSSSGGTRIFGDSEGFIEVSSTFYGGGFGAIFDMVGKSMEIYTITTIPDSIRHYRE